MLKPIIIVVLLMAFYIGFIAYSDFTKFSSNLSHFKFYYMPIILLLNLFSIFVLALRQQILFKKININIPLKNSLLLYVSALGMVVTPGGSGELIKSYFLKKKYGYNIARSFPIVFTERFHDLIAIIIIIAFSLIFNKINEVLVLVIILGLLAILMYGAVRSQILFNSITKIMLKIPRLNKLVNKSVESYDIFYSLTSKKITFQILLISVTAWSIQSVAMYLVFIAFGLNFNIFFTTIVVYSSVLLGAISLLPGGIGLTEFSFVSILVKEGVGLSLATSTVIMIRLVGLWFVTALGSISIKLFLSRK